MKIWPYNVILPPFTKEKQEMIKKMVRYTAGLSPKTGMKFLYVLFFIWLV